MNDTVQLPLVHVTTMSTDGIALTFREPKWMGERWIACLMPQRGKLIWGRFTSIDLESKTCRFLPDDGQDASLVIPDQDCEYLDGYWGERAEIVFAPASQWTKARFSPRDAVHHYMGGETKTVPGGWDHEHCAICWETISTFEGTQHDGYKNDKQQWVCENCFNSFIEPQSLKFITEPQQGG